MTEVSTGSRAPEGVFEGYLKEAGEGNEVFFSAVREGLPRPKKDFLVALGGCMFALDFKPDNLQA